MKNEIIEDILKRFPSLVETDLSVLRPEQSCVTCRHKYCHSINLIRCSCMYHEYREDECSKQTNSERIIKDES
jgi:hypothetical protein